MSNTQSNTYPSPEDLYRDLFYDVHRAEIFQDGKTFADAKAIILPEMILHKYREQKEAEDFDLGAFIERYFILPESTDGEYQSDRSQSLTDHLKSLWPLLERPADKKSKRTSIIPLPYPYVVPGGRFNEIYYWDSYFTMLGLAASDRWDIIESMVKNFQFLIEEVGHIPNGNRTYFVSRSQPPFFSLMVKRLIQEKGMASISSYIGSLIKEYNFWMAGIDHLTEAQPYHLRVAKLESSTLLNRYYDAKDTPREEMYGDDWHLINFEKDTHRPLFRHLRAACESGWDFSSRWLKDPNDLSTIEAAHILPIDLNCLLWHLEKLISECYHQLEKEELSIQYAILANQRKKAILRHFWNEQEQFFCDYHLLENKTLSRLSLAGLFPLYFGIATQEQADSTATKVKELFLKDGGLVTTPYTSGQQWDAPNGWAPLQWIAVQGLLKYGHKDLAKEIAYRWTQLNQNVYLRTGKMLEKYDVVDIQLEGGGGEYPVQDGFGWTNGVYLAMISK